MDQQKKGKVGQAAVEQAQREAAQKGRSDEAKRKEREKEALRAKKDGESAKKALEADLFKPAQIPQKVHLYYICNHILPLLTA